MKILNKKTITSTIWVLLLSCVAYGDSGETSGIILNKPVTANQAGLGNAVAGEDGILAMRINPAGLSGMDSPEISLMYNRGYFEDNFISATFAADAGFAGIGANVVYSATEKIGIWSSDNEYIEEIGQRDIILSLSASSEKLIRTLPLGINFTMLNSSIFGNSATAFSMGVGARYSLTLAGNKLNIGTGIQNIGTALKYIDHEAPLPAFFQAGASYSLYPGDRKLALNTDLRIPLNSDDIYLMGGLSYRAIPEITLLSGGEINLNKDVSGAKLNLGAEITAGSYKFSYVIDIVQDIDPSHYISLGLLLE